MCRTGKGKDYFVRENDITMWTANRWPPEPAKAPQKEAEEQDDTVKESPATTDSSDKKIIRNSKEHYERIYDEIRKQLEVIENQTGKRQDEIQREKELYLAERIVNASSNDFLRTIQELINALVAIFSIAGIFLNIASLNNKDMMLPKTDLVSFIAIAVLVVILIILQMTTTQKDKDRMIALEALNYYRVKNQNGEIFLPKTDSIQGSSDNAPKMQSQTSEKKPEA